MREIGSLAPAKRLRLQFSPRRALFVILIGAVAVRLAFILFLGHTLSFQTSGYDPYAVNLLAGRGYTRFEDFRPDSDLPPLYPFFLAGVYSLLGRSPISVALSQIGVEVITLITLYAIGRRVGGAWIGVGVAALTAFYPYLIFQNLSLNDTAVFLCLLALAILALYQTLDSPSRGAALRQGAWMGVCLGAAALTKTLALLILPLAGLWWWHRLGFFRALRLGLISGALALLVITPWVLRNINLHHAFVLISTNDGSNLHQGNNACVVDYLLHGWDAQWVDCLPTAPPNLNEVESANWHRDQAIAYVRANPQEIPRLVGVKLITLWNPAITPYSVPPTARLQDDAALLYETTAFRAARVLHLIYFGPLLLLALVGWWRAARLRAPIAPLLMVMGAITLAYVIFHPSTRYRLPADPFVFILSTYGIQWVMGFISQRRLRSPEGG